MGRYDTIQVNKNSNKKRYYKSIIYPVIEQLSSDIFIIAKETDRLDIMAHDYYNDDTLYWIIALCNNIYGSIFVIPGMQLCIPHPNRILEILLELKKINGE